VSEAPTPQANSILRAATVPSPIGLRRAPGEKPVASPAVRRRAQEAGVDLRQVRGAGPAGRITHEDLDAFLRGGEPDVSTGRMRIANNAVEEVKVIGL